MRATNDAPKLPLWMQALLLVAGALAMYRPVWAIDFGMHLAAGLEAIGSSYLPVEIPRVDKLSLVADGEAWIVHEWLVQVVFAWIYRFFGEAEAGIEALKVCAAAMCGTATLIFGRAFARRGLSPALSLAACLVLLWLFESRFRLRPHLVTLLGAALLLAQPRAPWSLVRYCLAGPPSTSFGSTATTAGCSSRCTLER